MNWWILTHHGDSRSLHHLFVVVRTNHPAHLYMAWDRIPPTRRPLWRTVRGTLIFCGYTYWWLDPTITQQNEPLNTFYHTFGPLTLASTDHVWYYLLSLATPSQRACQSALFHVFPPEVRTWTTKLYVGTQLKGVYYTENFTGPGGLHPTWCTVNEGLHSDVIWQLEPDPLFLAYRLYALAGAPGDRTLYVRVPSLTTSWLELLTNAAAVALTGSTSGELTWVAANAYFPGYLYVLFNSAFGDNGTWCLRSTDYGDTWTAHQLYDGTLNYHAANITASLAQGSSPHAPGTVLYASTNSYLLARTCLWRSLDHGATWTLIVRTGAGISIPRHLIDPMEPLMPYLGLYLDVDNPHELYRYTPDPPAITQVDGAHHLGPFLDPWGAILWVNPTDQAFLTALADNHLFVSIDYCLNWTDKGNIAQQVERLAILWENPDRFYLGRDVSGTPGPPHALCHVIFASEDYGATMYGKSGQWACTPTGHADSIPYNCGGICLQGIQLFPPY